MASSLKALLATADNVFNVIETRVRLDCLLLSYSGDSLGFDSAFFLTY